MNPITALREGLRIFARSQKVKRHGFKQYNGNAEKICQQIIGSCWNSNYFRVSAGHFCEFYIRDFGWCVDSLIGLGHKEQCLKTMEWALSQYAKAGRLATTITPEDKVIDVPLLQYSPDSLGYLMRTLRQLDAKELVGKYHIFIKQEVKRFFELVIDKQTGLVRKDKYFSSMKDHSRRKSSCYDTCFVAIISDCLDYFGLDNPFKHWDYKKLIKHRFWHNNYFLDDLSGSLHIAGDANTFPFWLGIFKESKEDKRMLKLALKTIQDAKLDKPFPLCYVAKDKHADKPKLNFASILAPDYETDSIWAHMAFPYIDLVSRIDKKKAKQYLHLYKKLIEKHKNFLEVYTKQGKPYKTLFYITDESMLWAANYLFLSRKLKM